ncbi:Kinetochore sub-complex COMA component [Komagataella phaffii CBS 7435]|uniref:Protein involved in minichromosome maintenance n=2 Tax=Komagataella phaffii TaxID=460519 RepID=C4R0I4_KOMPG|nr:Protein involved in minichromosome maintenance [Komagataella phaffii GS115]AOA62301.1 GQ67_00428T0 [Komagataella phaffii]CAH2448475.1 Kinetochore sub-complex COMA component [Komagataella phaffii CBS 7435]AOA67477.1 GQ68_00961T0 [Komagataella phaffii GS115]CAY69008.1 Protein involved in minichromosome maintenance [Komagataella phaffii GS115]CCA38594.1 Kinetochore sub-complex COMA component [Komagataella phaffii CBS 7435]
MSFQDDIINDINSLKTEIAQLQAQYNSTSRELDDLRKGVPQQVQHEHFESLLGNFINEPPQSKSAIKLMSRKKAYKQIHLENLYRMVGVTMFPVSNRDELLGIRFDIFDGEQKKFTVPHYIILQKHSKTEQWKIHRTTIPRYVPLQSIAKQWLNQDLNKFAKLVRKHLVHIQNKKSIVERVNGKLQGIATLEWDLDFTKIRLHVKEKFSLLLLCDLTNVVSVVEYQVKPEWVQAVGEQESEGIIRRMKTLLKTKVVYLEVLGELFDPENQNKSYRSLLE